MSGSDSKPGKESTDNTEKIKESKIAIEEVGDSNGQPKLSKLEFTLIFVGLFMAGELYIILVFLASLDQTIIGIAIPAIAKEFQALSEISWLGTAFLLTNTAFIPSYAKFAEIFGRKTMILIAISIFEIGSIVCGAATDMTSQNIKVVKLSYQGIIGAGFGMSSVAGPLLGGFLTDNISWRWNFYINVPIGAFAIIVCYFVLKLKEADESHFRQKLKRIDFVGTFFLIVSIVSLLIPIEGGGTQFAWSSATVITLLCLSGPFLLLFIYSQWKLANEPIVPLRIFKNRFIVAPLASTFFLGMSMVPLTYYTSLYFQIVLNHSAEQSGIDTIPLVMGLVALVILSGLFAGKTGHYFPCILLGSIMTGIGAYLMSTLDENSQAWQRIIYIMIPGFGLGMSLQTELIALQQAAEQKDQAVITAMKSFFQTIGGVFGLAIASSYFNNVLQSNLQSALSGSLLPMYLDEYVAIISNNPLFVWSPTFPLPNLVQPIIHAYVSAIGSMYFICLPFAAAMLFCTLFINMKPLSKANRKVAPIGE
ncbi:hypothetical protein HDV06_006113 [Boothiomyces sp. JEL0866]|nr:hypothetical protein HDV06_006113 [Boothiomyces sp. JEL0866]